MFSRVDHMLTFAYMPSKSPLFPSYRFPFCGFPLPALSYLALSALPFIWAEASECKDKEKVEEEEREG